MSAEHYKQIIDMLAVPHLTQTSPGMMPDMGGLDLRRIAIELAKHEPEVFMTIHKAINGDFAPATPGVDAVIVSCLKDRQIVQAIKRRRELTGEGLKEAKDYVDDLRNHFERTGKWESPEQRKGERKAVYGFAG